MWGDVLGTVGGGRRDGIDGGNGSQTVVSSDMCYKEEEQSYDYIYIKE